MGKTELCYKIIQHKDTLFKTPVNKTVLVYSKWQPLYDKIRKFDPRVIFIQGYPENLTELHVSDPNYHDLVIVDDKSDLSNSSSFMSEFTVNSHHMRFSICFLVHSIYFPSKFMKTIQLSATGFFLFKSMRDLNMIQNLARQIEPNKVKYKKIMNWYRIATSKPYGYLFVNLSVKCPEILRFRSDIFQNFGPMETFIMK